MTDNSMPSGLSTHPPTSTTLTAIEPSSPASCYRSHTWSHYVD